MFTESSEAIRIDHLSFLPPELLSTIFDLAHDPEHPLLKPLSKTLLPYHRQTLYRQIPISSTPSLSKLLAAVETTPSLAPLVQDLQIAYTVHPAPFHLESVANRFPSLKSLTYGMAQFSRSNPVIIAPLRSLSYSPEVFNSDEIDALSRLPLVKLELDFRCSTIKISDRFQTFTTMPLLEELTLVEAYLTEDEIQWDSDISGFVQRCPKLRSLKLVDGGTPRFDDFLEALVGGVPLLPITQLEFNTPTFHDLTICRFAHLYPRFPNLTFLSLGEGTTAPDLASHLRHLPFLTTLRLGPQAHFGFEFAEDFFSLVQAPTKPPALKLLILECFAAEIGFQCDTQDEMKPLVLESWSFREEWNEPRFSENIQEEECQQLLELAKANEVQVEGDIYTAINFGNSWNLERSNRQILYAFQNQTLERLKSFQRSPGGARFRELDIDVDQLDRNSLKLAKVDVPEEDWFQFTLE
ncbi:hypothetical protein JCM5350_002760 [Sporobolomyces pararoseus]